MNNMRQLIDCAQCGANVVRHFPAKLCFGCVEKNRVSYNKRKSQEFKETRSKLFGDKCAICGKKREHIHHRDLDRTNNKKSNLVALCWNCHSRVHRIIIDPLKKRYGFKGKNG